MYNYLLGYNIRGTRTMTEAPLQFTTKLQAALRLCVSQHSNEAIVSGDCLTASPNIVNIVSAMATP